MKKLTIPSLITSIGDNGLRNMPSLNTLVIKSVTPPSIGIDAFKYTINISTIYVPDSSVEAYKVADGWKDFEDKFKPLLEYQE